MEQYERQQQHLAQINEIAGVKGYTPDSWRQTWDALDALEQKAERLAEANALETYAGDWEQDRAAMEQEIKGYFIHPDAVVFNADPRGHAVRINREYSNGQALADWGGNIPIIPESLRITQ